MQIIRQLAALRERTKLIRNDGETIAFVPTMGGLHIGHMALVDLAKREADRVIVSIFVNPKQFGPNEDLANYPRREKQDAALLAEAGVTALWAPSVEEMYPEGFATNVTVGKLGDGLCGAARPGHFDGVATVVSKLFNQLRPDVAIFGEKDWQQLAIIRRIARDLDFDLDIIGMPTARDADGLALSSRNSYLDAGQRAAAVALPVALNTAATSIEDGDDIAQAIEAARAKLEAAGFAAVDYVSLVDARTLEPLTMLDREARLLAAARIGTTRLIDNLPVLPKNLRRH